MLEFFVKRPVTTTMFVMIFVVLGLVSYANLPIEANPEVDFPIVTVKVLYPGATPLEVETQVVKKIEDRIFEISDIDKVTSDSSEGVGYIFIEFNLGVSVDIKSIEVKDKVDSIINDLPDDIETPVIEKYDPLQEPVIDLFLASTQHDGRDLYEYADKELKDRFSSLPGVASVDITGGQERQINVFVDPFLMRRNYTTIYDVIATIKYRNLNVPVGTLERGYFSTGVRFIGEFQNVDEIAAMEMTSADGLSFPLKEIAAVKDSYKKIDSIARFSGEDIVALSISRVSDSNAVDVAASVRRQLDDINELLPEGMHLDVANDSTEIIISETNSTLRNILAGIILTILILFLFIGKAKLTFIAAVVIPTALISTMFPMASSGFTINSMTLLAIATCMGTLIANAIVILENVIVHIERGKTPQQAAVDGTKEVATAVLASTGTNLVVFTPIAFMGGIVGQFFRSFGLTVIYATIFSLIGSFTLTPMLCGLILGKNGKSEDKKRGFNPFVWAYHQVERALGSLQKEYKRIFDATFKRPLLTVMVMVFLFWSLRFIMPYVENEFMPSYDRDIISIDVTMPQGSTIQRTLGVALKIEENLEGITEVESYLTTIGDNGVENCTIKVDLVPSARRKRSDEDIVAELIPFMASIPDAEISTGREVVGGDADVTINVRGIDYDRMIEISKRMKRKMMGTGFFRSVESSYKTPGMEIQFIPDQKKLIEYGVSSRLLGTVLRAAVHGDDSNTYKEDGEEYDINVEFADEYKENFEDIKQVSVISRSGMIPITELGNLINERAVPTIKHRDGQRIIELSGNLSKGTLGYVTQLLEKEFEDIEFPPGYSYMFAGVSEHNEETQRETGKAFLLAVVLTYMLLCAIMNSFTQPFAIIACVATSFIGVFVTLFFSGNTINIASMLGMVMLVGLVVNNAILMLDYATTKMGEGIEVREALWLGASEKFKAIMMTSIAIMLGVMPQMFSINPAKRAMGAVIVGGMGASILFTFLFVPVLFMYITRFTAFASRKTRPVALRD